MPTILLVEDHDDIRDMITRHLQKRGLEVVTARNGAEAVSVCGRHDVALVLMDINMPEVDGFEATVRIRATETQRHVPVIALTAYTLPGDQARAKAAGCDAFHSKPVNFDRLFQQIDRLIGDATVS